ncbi:hypothetical protein FIBSPDRAFT_540757 [Athelia psychrophila]|uniref:Uncharacterized protein n=1 Tax=Athelia psychrophila TaxID=1759441 RepID=A0A166IY75_9AGAM|nr:hypothetical protein FIBSPDRAFT_540757 [Fibularhizoctonia sp. CBS 109695]
MPFHSSMNSGANANHASVVSPSSSSHCQDPLPPARHHDPAPIVPPRACDFIRLRIVGWRHICRLECVRLVARRLQPRSTVHGEARQRQCGE